MCKVWLEDRIRFRLGGYLGWSGLGYRERECIISRKVLRKIIVQGVCLCDFDPI